MSVEWFLNIEILASKNLSLLNSRTHVTVTVCDTVLYLDTAPSPWRSIED